MIFVFISSLFILQGAYAASFDCGQAKTKTERMICADPDVSNMDSALGEVFKRELENDVFEPSLRVSQRAWLIVRDACDEAACLKLRYEQRLAAISCDPKGLMAGSASGSIDCTSRSLRLLDRDLDLLEANYSRVISKDADDPEFVVRRSQNEQKLWRQYRAAQCTLYGIGEGGSPRWKSAFASLCEVDETQKRIARLKTEIGLQ